MALKSRITAKTEFDALADNLKLEYKEENGVWLLQSDDAAELRRAKDDEASRRRAAEDERDQLRRDKDKADRDAAALKEEADRAAARKAGDLKALEDTLTAQHNTALNLVKADVTRLEGALRHALVNGKAEAIAAEISTTPELLVPLIAARLDADISGTVGTTRVKDAAGNVSPTLTIDLLKKEVVDNPKYAAIIKGTNASGAGGNGGGSGGGAPSGKKITDMNEAEKKAHYNADPTAYRAQALAEGLKVRA